MRRLALLAATAALLSSPVEARITRLENLKVEPAFGGKVFSPTGAFERVTARAHGELDPKAAANAGIQDIELAPRNAKGMVVYDTDIDIIRPANPDKSNSVLLFNILNRGNKGALSLFNADVPGPLPAMNAASGPGDGWLQREGYTLVWFGWQADVLPGDNRMTLNVPVARDRDMSPVTGIVRSEITTLAATKTLMLEAGWFPTNTHDSAPTASLDNRTAAADGFLPSLTVRPRENAPRTPIANSEWSFADCSGATPTPDEKRICYPAGFQPGKLYELIYRAKDPMVMGIGFAVARDIGAFLKSRDKDDTGVANPVVHGAGIKTIVTGSSQSGRMIRSLIALGFNKDETGHIVFDGALPHIGGGLMPLNVRFAQPGRAWGQQIDHLYPAYDFPFTYARQTDPLTGRTQGLLDRCMADNTCPRIFHAATALEMWEGRQSLGLTDPLGKTDAPEPANVRTFIMASTQHAAASLPLPTQIPASVCLMQGNPNPHTWTMRALLNDLTAWVRDDKRPPGSAVPRIADGTLVPPETVHFPSIPANSYAGVDRPALRFLPMINPLHVLERGPLYRAAETSGIITVEPPRSGAASYGVLAPQVDADGNDVAGIRSLLLQVPIGTYTGWNSFRPGMFEEGFCNLSGSFIPFAATKAERDKTGDPRLSLEERYPTKADYVRAVRVASDKLIAARFLLPDDGYRLITEAETNGVRKGP